MSVACIPIGERESRLNACRARPPARHATVGSTRIWRTGVRRRCHVCHAPCVASWCVLRVSPLMPVNKHDDEDASVNMGGGVCDARGSVHPPIVTSGARVDADGTSARRALRVIRQSASRPWHWKCRGRAVCWVDMSSRPAAARDARAGCIQRAGACKLTLKKRLNGLESVARGVL